MPDLILHHYDTSPFSEKVRTILAHKQLAWRAVEQPAIMPKPQLTPLTGGYRRIPVLQIGADIYCDSQLIARVLEARHPQPTIFPGVPTLYVAINNHPRISQYNLRSIKACISGAAGLPVEVQKKFNALSGGSLVEGYGLSEASPVTHANPLLGENRIGTIGLPMPDTEVKLMDVETGQHECDNGQPGELWVRGPQVMKRYWNKPDETSRQLQDGWLRTGDVAVVDEDGYFKIVDRVKDLIIAGGFNIYPREIEDVLYEHPAVLEAAAAGVPDAYRGESVKVYIVLKPGMSATSDEITELHKDRKALISDHLSALVLEGTGPIMFHEVSSPHGPVLWVNHDIIARQLKQLH